MKKNMGFSTVELLITLFVAAAFLLSGYQLYSMIIKDGGETRMQARASNAAYDYLQQYKTDSHITNNCTTTSATVLFNGPITVTGLSNPNLKVTMSCPFTTTPTITKLEVKLEYGNGKSVTQATYVKK